jgi:hypothetical protein
MKANALVPARGRIEISAAVVGGVLTLLAIATPCAAQVPGGAPLASLYELIPGQPRIIPDGSGGAIITWADRRSGTWDAYAQRIDDGGGALWTPNGVALCPGAQGQQSPQIVSDRAGGAIIVWADSRAGEYDIYAQRIDGRGALQWGPGGLALCAEQHSQQSPQIASDGAGGAIVVWVDYRAGNYDIYGQRVSGAGATLWQANGAPVCSEPHDQRYPEIISDQSGGAIAVWVDNRNGSYDVYAQRVGPLGGVLWAADGAGICTGLQNQVSPQLVTDGAGGACIAWVDDRGGDWDIYGQRISAGGAIQWPANGVGICTAILDQVSPQLASDEAGGAIVTWADRRSGSWDIYAQRMSAVGVGEWAQDGTGVCTAPQDQFSPQIMSDGAGGAEIAWMDSRGGNNNIFAGRVGPNGRSLWVEDGLAVCFERHDQRYPQIGSDGDHGAIVTWVDFRAAKYAIYAQRVGSGGSDRWTPNGVAVSRPRGREAR